MMRVSDPSALHRLSSSPAQAVSPMFLCTRSVLLVECLLVLFAVVVSETMEEAYARILALLDTNAPQYQAALSDLVSSRVCS